MAVRLEFVGAVIILFSAILAVAAVATSNVDAGLVGMVLSYALNTTGALVSVLTLWTRPLLNANRKELAGAFGERGRAKRGERGAHHALCE